MIDQTAVERIRRRWYRTGIALFTEAFESDRASVLAAGDARAVDLQSWESALLVVWRGAGEQMADLVRAEHPKGRKQFPRLDREIIEAVTERASLIADATIDGLLGADPDDWPDMFDTWEAGRVSTIADTEAIAAQGLGGYIAGSQLELLRTWNAVGDEVTRPTHLDADGQTITESESYSVGGALLRYPGDWTGPPGEVINCRCWETYFDPADA